MKKAEPSKRQDIDLGIVRFEYGEAARARRAVLEIETRKHYNGGLVSSATVCWVGESCRQHCVALGAGGGDYSKRLRLTDRNVRATQKAIEAQHESVFCSDVVDGLVKAAKAHYEKAIEAGIDGFSNTYPAAAGER